jgi:hypothetical protein
MVLAIMNPGVAAAAPKAGCKLAFGILTDSFGNKHPINSVPPEVTEALESKGYLLTPFGAGLVLHLVAKTSGSDEDQATTVTAVIKDFKTGKVVTQGESTSPGMAIDANGAVFALGNCPK